MYPMLSFAGKEVPLYSLMMLVGLVVINIWGYFYIKKHKLDINDYIFVETYLLIGAIVGAKLLYLFVERDHIRWNLVFKSWENFMSIMRGGFVFYGGLIGALIFAYLFAGLCHKVNVTMYLKEMIFLFPMLHGFGRIGCFFAGCCYGMRYDGFLSVQFPYNEFLPLLSDGRRFPVQLVEAFLLMILSVVLYFVFRPKGLAVQGYIVIYAIIRFVLEYARDDYRGGFLGISTSQWISIGMIATVVVYTICQIIKKGTNKPNIEEAL